MLVIAGLDPGGGAGLAQDVRAVGAGGAFACPVAATLTVQSTSGLVANHPVAPRLVRSQAECVLEHQRVRAIKIGALGSAANVLVVAALLRAWGDLPVVLDPVRLPSRGQGTLLDERAFARLRRHLVPLATLVTANADEAAALTGASVRTVQDARKAASAIVAMGARAALVKGGHLEERRGRVVDVLAFGDRVIALDAPRLDLGALHGGGCTLASLVAARLARALPRQLVTAVTAVTDAAILRAVRWSKTAHHRALLRPVDVGGRASVLDV